MTGLIRERLFVDCLLPVIAPVWLFRSMQPFINLPLPLISSISFSGKASSGAELLIASIDETVAMRKTKPARKPGAAFVRGRPPGGSTPHFRRRALHFRPHCSRGLGKRIDTEYLCTISCKIYLTAYKHHTRSCRSMRGKY